MLSYQVEENLELRLVSERYAEEVAETVKNNLDQLSNWLPWATADYNAETAREFFKSRLEEFAKTGALSLLVLLDKKVVGGLGFSSTDKFNKSVEIGYWLAKEAQGKGIMTKCCRALIEHCFAELGFNRIVVRCATENKKSRAIPERLDFTKEGTARQAEWLHEKFVDLEIYSMLKEEWNASKQ